MRWAALAFAYSGLLSLCVAMPKHQKQLLRRESPLWVRHVLTTAGWAAIAGSLATSIWMDGWSFGPVAWVVQLAVTGMLLVCMLPYAPRVVLALGVLGFSCAVVILLR